MTVSPQLTVVLSSENVVKSTINTFPENGACLRKHCLEVGTVVMSNAELKTCVRRAGVKM
jgi:hypothetical protein